MQHGTDTEPQARAMYELTTGIEIREVGFVPHPTLAMAGASPDGVTMDGKGLVEIKCPQPAKHIKTMTGAKIDRSYLLQMQWQMICTGAEWCDFVSFSPAFPDDLQMVIRRVDHDAELAAEMEAAVTAFLAEVDAKERALRGLMQEAA